MKNGRILFVLIIIVGLINGTVIRADKVLGSEQNCLVLANSIGTFSDSAQYSQAGSGWLGITFFQNVGPRITLSKPTFIREIGAIANSTLPLLVQIRPSLNGAPNPTEIIETYSLSFDNDPSSFSYESAQPNVLLPAGTYFVLFVTQSGDEGGLLQTHPPFTANSFTAGIFDPVTGASHLSEETGAVYISGCETIGPPVTKEDCRGEQWRNFDYPRHFRSQGDCIQFVNAN
jgi:hypothetical protein